MLDKLILNGIHIKSILTIIFCLTLKISFQVPPLLPGTWELLVADGIASMHTAVTRFNTVVLLDRTNIGPSRKLLPKGHCRFDKNDAVLKLDCYAHSVLLDLHTNQIRPLKILTDTWCSSGQFLPNGTLLQTGGDLDGFKKIRKIDPCDINGSCDWVELNDVELTEGRWYASNQILPDGSVIIVGGRGSNTVEFYPKRINGAVSFPFLLEAEDTQMDNLYPYVHLLPNGHLFVFANTKAVMYDYTKNIVLTVYPQLDDGPRNYPSAGSSVMLALQGDYSNAEIVICGGARYSAFLERSTDTPAHRSCGRISTTQTDPVWVTEDMPYGRIMGDMAFGSWFMLPDGRVLLAGSNPHVFYKFDAEFPTELRIEAFSPEYLGPDKANIRPEILEVPETVLFGATFNVIVSVELPVVEIVEVNLASAPFATHSFSQGQRLVKLAVTSAVPDGGVGRYRIGCTAPPNGMVAPPDYYMVFAVNQGVPSVARWVHLS
ncbi:hypothetical protein AHAS_Ahas02G0178200 [Arachis hypogaea]